MADGIDKVLVDGIAKDDDDEHVDVLGETDGQNDTGGAGSDEKASVDADRTEPAASGVNRFAQAAQEFRTDIPADDPFPKFTTQQLADLAAQTQDPKISAALEKRRQGANAASLANELLERVLAGVDVRENLAKAAEMYPDLEDDKSPMFNRTMQEMGILHAGGYRGVDLPIRAAKAAASSLSRESSDRRGRDDRRQTASSFERPSGRQRDQEEDLDKPRLSQPARVMAGQWGITDPKSQEYLAQRLQEASSKVKARR